MQHLYVYIFILVLDEGSGAVGRKELLQLDVLATSEPYSCLYVNLVSPKLNEMFYLNFNKQIHPSS